MSRLLLIRPPAVFSINNYSSPVTMPLSLAYLSAALREKGHLVDNIDALGEGLEHMAVSYAPGVRYRGLSTEKIIERIAALPRPDAIGVTCMFSQEWPHIEDMILAIAAKFPDIPMMIGGEHATAAAEYTLTSCPPVKYVALGEGEETIVDFADFLQGRKTIDQVSGVWWRDDSGAIIKNPARARLRTPDQLPWPAWDLFDLEPYHAVGEGHGVERGRAMPILATRGCPYQCTFCSNPEMWTTRYVMRDPVKVVDEIANYLKKYKADNIDFYDLTAIVKKDWTLAFCNEIHRRGLKFTWQLPSGTRSEAMDDEALKAMAGSGCMNVTYAPESGSAEMLDYIKKRVKLPRLYDSLKFATKNGIFVKCNLIIGFPKETRKDMWLTVWAAIRFAFIGVDDCGMYPYSPYPGSELYHYLRSTGAIAKMDRKYFEGLMTFLDLSQNVNYCENVGAREISFYRLFGMSMFYGLNYLFHPSNILRSIRNYRSHRSDTVFEERIFAVVRRRKREKQIQQERRPERASAPIG
ncbi:MAG: radical SAM protein [Elusimicrobiota bacterium]